MLYSHRQHHLHCAQRHLVHMIVQGLASRMRKNVALIQERDRGCAEAARESSGCQLVGAHARLDTKLLVSQIAKSELADTDTGNDAGDNDDHGDSWRKKITLHRQQRQQTHQPIAFLSPRELVRPHTSRVARESHDDAPPVAGFRRASPEAHGLGSDSPACVGLQGGSGLA